MKEYICIMCPNGCHLKYDEINNTCEGNKCPRGKEYAFNEYFHPKRSVCTSVRTSIEGFPVVSVRTNGEIDKKLIPELLNELKKVVINERLEINSIVIQNVLNSGVDIITTTSMK